MKAIRLVAPILLVIHFALKTIFSQPQFFLDLLLFNTIALWTATSVYLSRRPGNSIGRKSTIGSILFWSIGAVLSSYNEFYPSPHISSSAINLCYVLFYPLIFLGLTKTLKTSPKLSSLEVLDATILGIGLSALGSAFFISPLMPRFDGDAVKAFFSILFPIADLLLVALILSLVATTSINRRGALLTLGVIVYAASDFLFLSLTVHGQYAFGSLSDDGWLLGLILIAEGFWQRGSEKSAKDSMHPIFIVLSVMLSATLLAITSLRPGYLPDFILIPTIATLLLAFIRMTIALRQSRFIGQERLLARTDELTGLPNRRRFITELETLANSSDGALLLLDLDGFKPINDQHGHEVGDQLLQQVSNRFVRVLPAGSLLARLGGDEFGAILRGNYESTLEVALALRATLSYPFSISGQEIHVGVSVGHVNNDGGANLLRRADAAMYQAKYARSGVFSEPSVSANSY